MAVGKGDEAGIVVVILLEMSVENDALFGAGVQVEDGEFDIAPAEKVVIFESTIGADRSDDEVA